jgi:hypothetical protein
MFKNNTNSILNPAHAGVTFEELEDRLSGQQRNTTRYLAELNNATGRGQGQQPDGIGVV